MIPCQPLEMTRGLLNSVQYNRVNYMYIQFTGSTSPPSSWLIRSVRWRHAWPGLYARHVHSASTQWHRPANTMHSTNAASMLASVAVVDPTLKRIGWMPRVCLEDCIISLQICRNTMQSSHLPRKHKVVHHHVSVSRDLYLCRYSHVIMSL